MLDQREEKAEKFKKNIYGWNTSRGDNKKNGTGVNEMRNITCIRKTGGDRSSQFRCCEA